MAAIGALALGAVAAGPGAPAPAAATQALVSKPAALTATEFYVSTTGSDTNNGSRALPWRTIQRAANVLTAGQTVYVRGGVYSEIVTVKNSGNATAGSIKFQSYPGETAIIDGTGLPCCGSSGSLGLFNLANKNYVIVQGFEIRNFSSNSKNAVPLGINVSGFGDHIELRDNNVHDIVTKAAANGGNAYGIGVFATRKKPINNLVITGNEVHHLKLGFSESLSLNGNVVNFTVSRNKVHDNDNIGIDCIGFEEWGPRGYDQCKSGVISENDVYNITSKNNPAYGGSIGADGLYCDGCTDVVFERNRVHAVDIGIEVASERAGRNASKVTVRDNLVSNVGYAGVIVGGYAANKGGSDHVTIVNNTFFNDAQSTGSVLVVQFNAADNVFTNNIVYSDANVSGALVQSKHGYTDPPVTMNNNLYSSTLRTKKLWLWNGVAYSNLSSFVAASGQDANSNYADPLFLSGHVYGDLHVAPNSPAVDRGEHLSQAVVGKLDFDGENRVLGAGIDIGAYEQ